MQTVDGPSDLPAIEGVKLEYVRNKCDPHVLISCRTGECFTRSDGEPWEWPGYKVALDTMLRKRTEGATAYCDTAQYPPEKAEAA